MRVGRESHMYAGAMRRGLSERTWVGLGLDGWKGSCGQARLVLVVETNVGVVNAAVLVCGI